MDRTGRTPPSEPGQSGDRNDAQADYRPLTTVMKKALLWSARDGPSANVGYRANPNKSNSSVCMAKTRVPHPIPYQGSKRHLADTILGYAPNHVTRLVEPFAGSAAISLAAASRGLADRYWINDAHVALMDLWKEILHSPEPLARQYDQLWEAQLGREREYFDHVALTVQ